MKITRRYGPFLAGYVASRPEAEIPHDALGIRSHDMLVDPLSGWVNGRGGTIIYGTARGTGWLETIASGSSRLYASARRLFPLYRPGTGQHALAGLWTDERASLGGGGQIAYLNGSGTPQVIGQEYGATHYPDNFKVLPIAQRNKYSASAAMSYARLVDADQRALYASGSANALEASDQLMTPGYNTIPLKWNRRSNDAAGSGTENLRAFPIGVIPPCYEIRATFSDGDNTSGTWQNGKYFAVATVFEMADGSRSMPGPIPKHHRVVGGIGRSLGIILVTNAQTYSNTCNLTGIAIGPEGCKRRYVCASPIANTDAETNIYDLRLWHIIENNTDTTAEIRHHNLTADPLLVRYDHIWMPPAKWMWAGDGRLWCGRTRQHPTAIVLCPPRSTCNVNDEDVDTGGSTAAYLVTNTGTAATSSLTLKLGASTTAFSFSTYDTLQKLVDAINITIPTEATKDWRAQIVNGTSPEENTLSLLATSADLTGDQAAAGAGYVRCYSNAYPGLLHLQHDDLSSFSEQDRRIFFTVGGPGAPPMAAEQWVAGNHRTGEGDLGTFLGGGNAVRGQVCVFSGGIAVIQNRYAGGTGQDVDYRMFTLNQRRGCLTADSICQFNGCVGYMTSEGYMVCDGEREVCISDAIYSPSPLAPGTMIAAVRQAIVNLDTGAEYPPTFMASVWDGRLYLSYLADYESSVGWHMDTVVYDFSGGTEAGGIGSVLNGDKPWPWSSPLQWNRETDSNMSIGAIASVPTSAGAILYGSNDRHLFGDTNPGRVDRLFYGNADWAAQVTLSIRTNVDSGTESYLEVMSGDPESVALGALITGNADIPAGARVIAHHPDDQSILIMDAFATGAGTADTTFDGVAVRPAGYAAHDLCDTTRKKSLERVTHYFKATATGLTFGGTGSLSVFCARDNQLATETRLKMPSTDVASLYSRVVREVPLSARTPGEAVALWVADDGAGVSEVDRPGWWMTEAEIEVIEQQI